MGTIMTTTTIEYEDVGTLVSGNFALSLIKTRKEKKKKAIMIGILEMKKKISEFELEIEELEK